MVKRIYLNGGYVCEKMAVYCGASLGNEPIYQQAAVALAAWMKITMI